MNITLRPTTMEDLPGIMGWVNDPDITHYFARMGHVTLEQERAYLEKMLASEKDRLFTILADGEYAGQCSINEIYWPAKNGRLFIVLTKKFQGRKLAPRVIEALLRQAFDVLKLHKVWLIVREENTRSQFIYQNSGFSREGILIDEYFVNEKYLNMVRMAILDWQFRQWHCNPMDNPPC